MVVKGGVKRILGGSWCCAKGHDTRHHLNRIVEAVAIGLDGIGDIECGEVRQLAAQLVAAGALSWPEGDALDITLAQDEAQVASLRAAGPAAYDARARTYEDGFLEGLTEGRELGQGFGYIRHDASQ